MKPKEFKTIKNMYLSFIFDLFQARKRMTEKQKKNFHKFIVYDSVEKIEKMKLTNEVF